MSERSNDGEAKGGKAKSDVPGADLDQIRQILVGSYLQEIDVRFQNLGTKLSDTVEELRRTLMERTNDISSKFDEEMRKLGGEIDNNRDQSSQARDELKQEIASAKNDLQQQVGALSQTLAATESAIRQDTSRGMNELKEQIRAQLAEIRGRMDSEFTRLDGGTVSRKMFSHALRELSKQIDDDSTAN